MVLGKAEIKSRGLIVGGIDDRFREGSYDLTIKELVTAEGKITKEYVLPAQGIVKVISKEVVRLPADVIGYVLVKTQLCNEGVLALNIGIVDPGFDGPLQSALINFGKADVPLLTGDVFSRVSFHALSPGAETLRPVVVTHDSARRDVKRHVGQYLAPTFLNIAATADKAADQAFAKYKKVLTLWIPVFALLLAGLTYLLNFGNMANLYGYIKPQDYVKTELMWREVDDRVKKLEIENERLRQSIAHQASSNREAKTKTGAMSPLKPAGN